MAEDAKTPSQIADEARQTGRDAAQAAAGLTQEAKAIGAGAAQALRSSADDARTTGREAADTAKGLANDARDIAGDAAATGRRYAKDAVQAASAKLRGLSNQASELQVACTRYVAEEPVKSILYAAAGGAFVTALLISFMRGGSRR